MASHARVKEVFAQVVDLEPEVRRRLLDVLCADDADLRREVESLLGHDAAPRIRVPELASLHDAVAEAAESLRAAMAAPDRVGGYRIIDVLGEGGMGVVYLAEQDSPRRTVALKLMRPGFASRDLVRRFRREAEVLGRLQHPNIAAIHEAGSTEVQTPQGVQQIPYFAMEYVRGEPITLHCRERALDARARAALVAKVADAVEHAHGKGIVHRDLKPANILVDERGEPKILDFGIARREGAEHAATTLRTEVGQVVGTLPYMSPEQVSGRPDTVDRRTDVYALGVLLYELLAGRLPLDVSKCSVPEAVRMVSEEDPPALATLDRSLRGDLDTIAAKCLEKEAGRRYQSAGEFAADLKRYLDDRPIDARPASRLYMLSKFARRNRPLVAGVVVAFLTLVVATAVSIVLAVLAVRARQESEEALRFATIENRRSSESFSFLAGMIQAANPTLHGGREITVREMLDGARKSLLERTGEEPHVTAMLLRTVGFTYERIGCLEPASEMLARSVALFRTCAEPGDGQFVKALKDYGYVLQLQGRLKEADAILTEAVGMSQDPRVGPWTRAGLLNNLGLLAEEVGDYERAADLYQQAIALRRGLLGTKEDTDLGILHINTGSVLISLGRVEDAERSIREGMRITDATAGPQDQYSLTARNNLAVALRGQGRYDEALALIREVYERRLAMNGADSHQTMASLGGLANCTMLSGDVMGALPLLEQVVDRRTKLLGPSHVDTAAALVGLGNALRLLGRLDEAQARTNAGAAALEAALGPRHPKSMEAVTALARLALDAGRHDEALRRAEAVLAEARADLSAQIRVSALAVRAKALLAMDRATEALATVDEAQAAAAKGMTAAHPDAAALLVLRAEALLTLNRLSEARLAAEDAAGRLRRAVPDGPWRAAEADATLARVLRAEGRLVEADRIQAAAVENIVAALGPGSPTSVRACRR